MLPLKNPPCSQDTTPPNHTSLLDVYIQVWGNSRRCWPLRLRPFRPQRRVGAASSSHPNGSWEQAWTQTPFFSPFPHQLWLQVLGLTSQNTGQKAVPPHQDKFDIIRQAQDYSAIGMYVFVGWAGWKIPKISSPWGKKNNPDCSAHENEDATQRKKSHTLLRSGNLANTSPSPGWLFITQAGLKGLPNRASSAREAEQAA